jgi:prevent-host-death family protein
MTVMTSVGMHEAKTTLSKLVRRVQAGETIEITSNGVPVARLVAATTTGDRVFGIDRGLFVVPEDFDAPLDAETLDAFS